MTPHKKALVSEYFTVAWNLLEGIIAIAAGIISGSIALVGFGIDSYIEVASGLVLIWRLRKLGFNDEEEEATEKKAILFVGVTFIVLALYVTYESLKKLYFYEHPEESLVGIVLAIVSLIVMPFLAIWEEDCRGDRQPHVESRRLGNPCLFLSFSCAPSWLGGQRSVRLVVG